MESQQVPPGEDLASPERTASEYIRLSSNITQNEKELGEVVANITERIESGTDGSRSFSNFLRDIAPYIGPNSALTDSALGIELLSRVLTNIKPEILSRNDVSAVTTLLCVRIRYAEESNYRANIKDTASSLFALSQMKNFLRSDVVVIYDDFFSLSTSLWTQQLVSTRLSVYELLSNLLESHREELLRQKDIGQRLAEGFTGLAVPEKDPACLRLVFPIYHKLSKERDTWKIDDASLEKIWESYVRYYPIKIASFGRKAWDSTKPDPLILQQLLLKCFTSNSGYAQWAFPRLIDLLDVQSDVSADVKNDALKTLAACVEAYDASTIEKHTTQLWDSVKFEVLNGENEDFIEGALVIIKELAKKSTASISETQWTSDTAIPPFLISVAQETSQRLREPAQRYTPQCGRILGAVASTSPFAFHAIIRLVTAGLLTIYQSLDSTLKKDHMVRLFNNLIQACASSVQGCDLAQESQKQAIETLRAFQPSLVEIYFEAMSQPLTSDPADAKFRVATIQGLSNLFQVPGYYSVKTGILVEGRPIVDEFPFLSEYEKGTIVDSLSKIVLVTLPVDKEIYEEAITALQITAIHDPSMFRKITLENFLDNIPNFVPSDTQVQEFIPKLECLSRIACTDLVVPAPLAQLDTPSKNQLFFDFSEALLRKLQASIQHEGQQEYAVVLVATLLNGLKLFDAALDKHYPGPGPISYDGQPSIGKYGPYGDIMIQLYRLCVERKVGSNAGSSYMGLRTLPCGNETFSPKLLSIVGKYANSGLSSRHTPDVASPLKWRSLAVDGPPIAAPSMEIWTLFDKDFPPDLQGFCQYDCVNGPPDKCSANILSMSLLAGIGREPLGDFSIGEIAANMIANAVSSTSGAQIDARMSFNYTLQLLINKFGAIKAAKAEGIDLVEIIRKYVNSASALPDFDAYRIYQTLAYMASAALLAFDASHAALITIMLENLQSPRSIKIAQSFRILLAPSDIIKEQNSCLVRPLAKGRLYSLAVPYLITEYSKPENSTLRESYLIALASILSYLPLQVIKSDAARLLPLLLAGTDTNNAGDGDRTKMDCIHVINQLIPEIPEVIEEHLDSIINRMAERTHNTMAEPSDASPPCRKLALECLRLLAVNVRPIAALKRKQRVMRELEIASNDVSRIVRTAADRARIYWFNVTDDDVQEE